MTKLKTAFPSLSNIEIVGRVTFTIFALPIVGTLIILSFALGWTAAEVLIVLSFILLGLSLVVLVSAFVVTYVTRWRRSRITTGL